MEQNKVRTYTLYAVGEVALVMIGILLALQVNNWNEERLDRIKEQEILHDLKVEFEANLVDLQRTLNEHRIVYAELKELQQISLSGNFDNPALDSLTFGFIRWFTFTDRPGASSNLINSGNLNLISNKELRDLITQWPGIAADVKDDEVFMVDYIREILMPLLAELYPLSNVEQVNDRWIRSFEGYRLDLYETVKPLEQVNWNRLLDNNTFQSHLALRKLLQTHSMIEGEKAERACLEILRLINEELGLLL
ncbi:DUF6090 family protein [Rhodohalobacter mucosus]|nr:DUF6090 family protein [Rhodohalobacter mucosus]